MDYKIMVSFEDGKRKTFNMVQTTKKKKFLSWILMSKCNLENRKKVYFPKWGKYKMLVLLKNICPFQWVSSKRQHEYQPQTQPSALLSKHMASYIIALPQLFHTGLLTFPSHSARENTTQTEYAATNSSELYLLHFNFWGVFAWGMVMVNIELVYIK